MCLLIVGDDTLTITAGKGTAIEGTLKDALLVNAKVMLHQGEMIKETGITKLTLPAWSEGVIEVGVTGRLMSC